MPGGENREENKPSAKKKKKKKKTKRYPEGAPSTPFAMNYQNFIAGNRRGLTIPACIGVVTQTMEFEVPILLSMGLNVSIWGNYGSLV
jgi:hypothetical protein